MGPKRNIIIKVGYCPGDQALPLAIRSPSPRTQPYGDAHLRGHKPGRQFTGLEHGGSKLTRSAKNEQTGRPKLSNEETKQSLMKLSRTCISNQNKINFKCFPHHFE
uniref:(northern house mosquito) hypothetical protein n=1 Tax=Culex pipiens TaxID=7175 RepID=A0A8D8L8G4_CULPI